MLLCVVGGGESFVSDLEQICACVCVCVSVRKRGRGESVCERLEVQHCTYIIADYSHVCDQAETLSELIRGTNS